MKKRLIAIAALILALVSPARAAEISNIPWTQSNIESLHAFDKDAVVRFVNQVSGNEGTIIAATAGSIGDFRWVDLAGNGTYQLLVVYDVNGRGFFNELAIYTQDSSGKVRRDDIGGWGIGLEKGVRDLDEDGKQELIIPKEFFWDPTVATPSWPSVYRLRDGRYVEASREFPDYYDGEVLPPLEKKIAALEQQAASTVRERQGAEQYIAEHGWWESYDQLPADQATAITNYGQLAVLQMTRTKILRVVGRDPQAGVAEAREWMKSPDQQVGQAAGEVFRDVGGHEEELRTLRESGQRLLDLSRARHEEQKAAESGR